MPPLGLCRPGGRITSSPSHATPATPLRDIQLLPEGTEPIVWRTLGYHVGGGKGDSCVASGAGLCLLIYRTAPQSHIVSGPYLVSSHPHLLQSEINIEEFCLLRCDVMHFYSSWGILRSCQYPEVRSVEL